MKNLLMVLAACLCASCSVIPKSFSLPEIADRAPDPRICAAIEEEPAPPDFGELELTDDPRNHAVQIIIQGHMSDVRAWGHRGWEVVEIAQERC